MRIVINALLLKENRIGVSNYIYNLVYGLSKVSCADNFILFTNKKSKFSDINLDKRFSLKHIYILDKIPYSRVFWEQFFMPKVLKDLKINVFHSPSFILPINLQCKTVLTVHDLSYLLLLGSYPKIKQIYYERFVGPSILRADKIIAISESTKKDIMHIFKIQPEKIEVIYYGLNPLYRRLEKEELDKRIKKSNLPERFILYVGTIEPRKNLERLIMAFYKVKKDFPGYKLIIAGPKMYKYQKIIDLVNRLGLKNEVIFTGYICSENLLVFYNAASIFVYPSLYEGFGLPILEAFACGAPVITSDIPSLSEIAGGAAILVSPRNSDALAERMISVLEDMSLQKELSQKGIERARHFNWIETAKKTLLVYEKVCRENLKS